MTSRQPSAVAESSSARRWFQLALVVGGLIGFGSAWLEWTVSGSASRNSYASLRSAQRLGLEQLTPLRVVWFLVPVAVATATVALAARADRWAAGIGLAVGVALLGFGVAVIATPVAATIGPVLSCVGGVIALVGSGGLLAQGRSQK